MNQREKPTRGKYHPNLVLKVKQFDLGREQAGCYSGAVEGEVVGGPSQGKTVRVTIKKTLGNGKVARFEDIVKPETKIHVPVGGYLGFRSVWENKHECKANWVNKFADPGAELRIGVPIQIAPVLEIGGGLRRFKSNNSTMYRAFILNTREALISKQPSDVHEAVSKVFAEGHAAFLRMIAPNQPRETMVLWRGWRDGQPTPMEEAALKVFDEPNLSKFELNQKRGGKIDVVPLESIFISPGTAESIDNQSIASIAIRDYTTGGIGGRVEAALKESRNLNTIEFEKCFLAGLDKNAKGAFAKYGLPGIWTSDIVKFFQDLGIEPPKVPIYGYSLSNAVIKKHEFDDGQESYFLTKARSLGPTVTRDFVPTPSDEGSIERYFTGFRELVAQTISKIEQKKTLDKEVGISREAKEDSLTKVFDNTPANENSGSITEKTPRVPN